MKRSLAIVTLVILALALPATMLAQQNSKAEKEIRAISEEIRTAAIKGGDEAIRVNEKYTADDFVRIPGFGAIFNKAEYLNGFKTGIVTVESLDDSDVKIRIDGKMAVLTAIQTGKGVQMGTPWTGTFRFSRVFVKRGGVWQCVLYQSTPIKQ